MESVASKLWPYVRPFVKVLCQIVRELEPRVHRHIDGIESVAKFIYEVVEAPLLLFGVFYGTIFGAITGVIAGTLLAMYSLIAFWPVIFSLILKASAHLLRSVVQFLVSIYSGPTGHAWATWEDDRDDAGSNLQTYPATVPNAALDYLDEDFLAGEQDMEHGSGDDLDTEREALGSWKVSDTLEQTQSGLGLANELRISTSPPRRHRRTGTGSSSLSLSGASSPELVRTPLVMNTESRDEHRRRHRSGSSSPESYFRMTALTNGNRAQSTSDLRRHNRSGSSSTTSLRSVGRIRGLDRI